MGNPHKVISYVSTLREICPISLLRLNALSALSMVLKLALPLCPTTRSDKRRGEKELIFLPVNGLKNTNIDLEMNSFFNFIIRFAGKLVFCGVQSRG